MAEGRCVQPGCQGFGFGRMHVSSYALCCAVSVVANENICADSCYIATERKKSKGKEEEQTRKEEKRRGNRKMTKERICEERRSTRDQSSLDLRRTCVRLQALVPYPNSPVSFNPPSTGVSLWEWRPTCLISYLDLLCSAQPHTRPPSSLF